MSKQHILEKMDVSTYRKILTLIDNFNWGWNTCEYGAPAVDPKRPFGNSTDIDSDVLRILGEKPDGMFSDEYSEKQREYAANLYTQTLGVLTVLASIALEDLKRRTNQDLLF